MATDKKAYHHDDLRGKLLRAAELALADMPVNEVTLREVARRAGVSHAAPKHHFSSLGDLMGEVAARGFDRFVETLAQAVEAANDATAEGKLRAMARAYLGFSRDNASVYGLMFGKSGHCNVTPHLAQASLAAWSQLENAVAELTGRARAADGAVAVWSSVHGLSMLVMERQLPPQISLHVATETVMRTTIAGLKAEMA
jgi:AcrR family transcriptional regulator